METNEELLLMQSKAELLGPNQCFLMPFVALSVAAFGIDIKNFVCFR